MFSCTIKFCLTRCNEKWQNPFESLVLWHFEDYILNWLTLWEIGVKINGICIEFFIDFIWALSLEYKNVNTFIIYIVWRFKDFSLTFITLNLVCSRYPEILFDQAHNIWLTYVLTLKKNCCVLRFYKSCPWLQLSVLSVLWFGWEPTCTYLYCRYKF